MPNGMNALREQNSRLPFAGSILRSLLGTQFPITYLSFGMISYLMMFASFAGTAEALSVSQPAPDVNGDPGFPLDVAYNVRDVFSGSPAFSVHATLANNSALPPWLSFSLVPEVAGHFSTPTRAYKVSLFDDARRALVADSSQALLLDTTNSSAILELGRYVTPNTNFAAIPGEGSQVFTANWVAGVDLLDWSVPATPSFTYRQSTPGSAIDLLKIGSELFVSDNTGGASLYNIQPQNISYVMTYPTAGAVQSLLVEADRVIAADDTGGLRFFNRSTAQLITSYATAGGARGVASIEDVVYVASDGAGIYAVNGSVIPPSYIVHEDTAGRAFEVISIGRSIALADGSFGARIYDVNDPSRLNYLATCASSGELRGVAQHDSLLYMASGTGGLDVCDIGKYRFTGTPPSPQLLQVKVTAIDDAGQTVSDTFEINIGGVTTGTTAVAPTTGTTAVAATATTAASSATAATATTAVDATTAAAAPTAGGLRSPEVSDSLGSADQGQLLIWLLVAAAGLTVCCLIAGVIAFKIRRDKQSSSGSSKGAGMFGGAPSSSAGVPPNPAAAAPTPADDDPAGNYQTVDVGPVNGAYHSHADVRVDGAPEDGAYHSHADVRVDDTGEAGGGGYNNLEQFRDDSATPANYNTL